MEEELTFHICVSDKDFEIAKELARDYMEWLGMDLNFQNVDKEFQVFDTMYGKSQGCFIYATIGGEVAGGGAVRKLEKSICEMKRLFVYQKFQSKGLGRMLCDEIVIAAKRLGYSRMRLDTVEKLESAISLYQKMGFYEIPAYYPNPDPTVKYMEMEL